MKFLFYIAYLVCVSSLPISSLPERHLKPINQSLLGLSNDHYVAKATSNDDAKCTEGMSDASTVPDGSACATKLVANEEEHGIQCCLTSLTGVDGFMFTGKVDGCLASAHFGLSAKTQASPYVIFQKKTGEYKNEGDKNIQAGCQQGSWLEAEAKCKSVGGRLCTVEELGNGCADQTGCWYDQRLVWTSDAGEHKVAKATSNDDAKCTEGMSDASSTPDASACATKLVANEEIHGIQCCETSSTGVDGFICTGEVDRCWASADFGLSDKTQASPYVTYSINEGQYKSVGDKNIQAGCQQGSWLEAVGKCKSVGGRLCTVEELGNGCADQTGCWYDQRLVWTSDVKEHKVAKATSNEHAKCTEGMSVASSFPDGSACATKLVVNEEIHGIQCCLTSDTDVDGFMSTGKVDRCLASADFGLSDKTQASPYVIYSKNEGQYKDKGTKNIQAGCQQGTWSQAEAKCKSVGGRLCTVEELGYGCADQTGCWYDQRLVWTSDV